MLTRFLDHLGIEQEQGRNLAMFDLFDRRHARYVLTLFGQAYGALPKFGDFSADQESFLTAAVNGLAEDGRVVCVRLSLFAEMLKRVVFGRRSCTGQLDTSYAVTRFAGWAARLPS